MMSSRESLQNLIGYNFKNSKHLEVALTHQSYANEMNVDSYERLEFLGDAVIELVVSKYLYENFSMTSGKLTKLRSALVSTENLSKISNELNLNKLVKKAKSLQTLSKKNLADLVESVIGAVYLDGGIDECVGVINKVIIKSEDNIKYMLENCEDSKTELQELLQSKAIKFEYKLVSSMGLDHEKIFEVELLIDGNSEFKAKGKSIREAEENCAKGYLNKINN